jgi:TnpA family transposase
MAEIVNLNQFRKAKARESDRHQAAENRVRFGRNKVEKENDRRAAERRDALLSGKELEKRETGSVESDDTKPK